MKPRYTYLFRKGDIVYCQYFDREDDEYKRSFGFIVDRVQERGEWGVDIMYKLIIQNGPHSCWLFERDIIKIIDRKPYDLGKEEKTKI